MEQRKELNKKIFADFIKAACRLGEELLDKESFTHAEQEFLNALDKVVDNYG